jgi:hypothetical protein
MQIEERRHGKHHYKSRHDIARGQVGKTHIPDAVHGFQAFQRSDVPVDPDKKQESDQQQEKPFVTAVLKIIMQGLALAIVCLAERRTGCLRKMEGVPLPQVIELFAKDAGSRSIEQGVYFLEQLRRGDGIGRSMRL